MTRHQIPSSSADLDPAVPPSIAARAALRERVSRYIDDHGLVAPVTLEQLVSHAARAQDGEDPAYAKYAAVLMSNELWRPVLASVPYERRLLLLPQCLRGPDCPAQVDEWGVVCAGCGRCPIHDFQAEARRLGYVVLIAEGSPMVLSLIESGQVEAVVGVSCLATLERVFPYMQAAAIPGIALPMLTGDCHDGAADLDWIWEAMYLSDDAPRARLDLEAITAQVATWFAPPALDETLGPADDATARIAREALTDGGKRWRPFLLAACWQACQAEPGSVPEAVRQLAVAVECFHKASLVHDDIEDDDSLRDGRPALHAKHGLGVALNAGDLLLGEGYRLIARADLPPDARAEAMAVAAEGHRRLAMGQGRELLLQRAWALEDVLAIAEAKTGPAFEVALRLGALAAGAADAASDALADYCRALGVAYQLQDDLADTHGDLHVHRPSAVLAAATGILTGRPADLLARLRAAEPLDADAQDELRQALTAPAVVEPIRALLDQNLRRAQVATERLASPGLRTLLRRVLGKLFARTGRTMPCCLDLHPREPDA